MRYEARLTAFDMLDQVHIVLGVFQSDGLSEVPHTLVAQRVLTVRGTGESDPFQWARDALVAALEDL